MINLNRLALFIRQRYLETRLLTAATSEKARILRISASWRKLFNANNLRDKNLTDYTEKEVAAADIILDCLEYLNSNGSDRKDIEKLLRDRLDNLEEE